MAKTQTVEQENTETGNVEEAQLVTRDDAEVMKAESSTGSGLQAASFGQLEAEIQAEIQNDLLSLSVDQVTSAKNSLLEIPLTLHDAILMTFEGFKSETDDGQRVVFFVTDDSGIEYKVAQAPVGSRLTVFNIFNKIRMLGRKAYLTNVVFREVGKGRFGNKAVILTVTPKTQSVFE